MNGKDLMCWITDFVKLKTHRVTNTLNSNAVHMLKSVKNTICDSFIITTDDGKVIVIDGGFRAETKYFLDYLRQATGHKKPRVDAWFLTHPHSDHCDVFLNVAENYSDKVEIGKIYLNFAPKGFYSDTDNDADNVINEYEHLRPKFAEKERILHNDNVFSIGAAKITVLNTFDPSFSGCNDSSLIFKMELGCKSIMFTGDSEVNAAKKVLREKNKPALLKCDVCKMSHHGQNGCHKEFYEAVSPEICLWPTPSWIWNNRNGNLRTPEAKKWIQDIGVRENIVSKDGSTVIIL